MLKKVRGLISDAATYGASSVLRQVIAFFLLPLYTSYLSPTDYGITAMLAVLTTLFIPIANLGMTNAIFRRFNLTKNREERLAVLSTGLMSLLLSSVVLFCVGQALAKQLTLLFLNDSQLLLLVRLTLLSAMLGGIGQAPIVVLRADRRVRVAAGLNVISLLVSISVTIWFVVVKEWGVFGIVLGSLVAEAVTTIMAFWATRKLFHLKLDLKILKWMLSYGLPFLPHRVQSVGLVMFGQYIVGEMLGLEQAGLYNIALKFVLPLQFVIGSVQQAWVPYKFQIHANDDDPASFFRSVTVYYIAGISYLWVGVSLWGIEALKLMTTESFHAASALISVLALVQVGQGLYFMLGTGFEFTNNTKPFPLVSLSGLIVVVLGAFLLVPQLGAMGAALATFAGWVCMTVVVYWLARSRFHVPHDWPTLFAVAVLACLFVVLGSLFQNALNWVRLSVSVTLCLVYPPLVFAILLRSPTERERMQALLSSFRHVLTHRQWPTWPIRS